MKQTCGGWLIWVVAASGLTWAGCEDERPAMPPKAEATAEIPPAPAVKQSTPAPKAEAAPGETGSEFEAARRKIEELEKSLPAIETVLASQVEGAEGLKAVGEKMLELGKGGKLTEMQAIFKNFKASQADLTELFGPADTAKQWPGYAKNSSGFVTIAEKFTADIKDGRYDQVEVVELKADEKPLPAVARMLAALNGKTPVFKITFGNSQKPKEKRPFYPLVFVQGNWRYLMNVYTSVGQ